MGRQEKTPPAPSEGTIGGIIHIHILWNCDNGSVVTTISYDEEEDWSEHIDNEID